MNETATRDGLMSKTTTPVETLKMPEKLPPLAQPSLVPDMPAQPAPFVRQPGAIAYVPRWQWIIISLIVGALIGWVRSASEFDPTSVYPNSINTQQEFETAILSKVKAADGREIPHFTNLVVYRIADPRDGKQGQLVYIVAGSRYVARASNRGEAKYLPYFFWADTPYRPLIRNAGAAVTSSTSGLKGIVDKLGLRRPDPPNTVLNYLDSLASRGVSYRHIWWREGKVSMIFWMVGCFAIIGLVWPTLIYLIAFGKLTPPPKPVKPKLHKSKPETKKAPVQADMNAVKAMGDELEAKLMAGARPRGPVAPVEPIPEPQIRKLTAEELRSATAEQRAEQKRVFGADADDFYPTERHIKPKEDEK